MTRKKILPSEEKVNRLLKALMECAPKEIRQARDEISGQVKALRDANYQKATPTVQMDMAVTRLSNLCMGLGHLVSAREFLSS